MEDGCVVLLPGAGDNDVCEQLKLPLGFRFHPTDEELVTYYLSRKVSDHGFSAAGVIGEVDLNKCEPWDLPWMGASTMGEKEWYFFCVRDRKYPAGLRANRATDSGYWKATGKDKEVRRQGKGLVGRRKTLVFYEGRAPRGEKTCWVMHEYRLDGSLSLYNKAAKNEWVICRVFQRGSRSPAALAQGGDGRKKVISPAVCYGDGGVRTGVTSNYSSPDLLPPLMEPPFGGTGSRTVGATTAAPGANHVTCFSINVAVGHKSHELGTVDYDDHSSSPFMISTPADRYIYSSSVDPSSVLPLGKLISGEAAGPMNLQVRSHGYAVQEGIGGQLAETGAAPGSSTSQITDMHMPGSSPALLVSSHEVFIRQKIPSDHDPAGVTIPLADHCIWNY